MVVRILSFVVDRPKTVIVTALLFVAIMATGLAQLGMDPSVKSMLPRDTPTWINLERLEDLFGSSEIVLVTAEVEDLLGAGTIAAMATMEEELAELPDVDRVVSPLSLKYLEADEGTFTPVDLIDADNPPRTDGERDEARRRILSDDLYVGSIVSPDLKHVAFVVMLTDDFDDTSVAYSVRNVVDRNELKITLTGLPITRIAVTDGMKGDLKMFLPAGIVVMILLLVLSFKTWLGAILPLLVVLMSVASTFGLMGLVGEKIRLVTVIIPVMLVAVANDYGIHLVAHYLGSVSSNPDLRKRLHVLSVTRSLGVPVLTAGITTVAGFLTLTSHVIGAVKVAGVMAAFGIVVAFTLSLTFIPAMLMILPTPPVAVKKFAGGLAARGIGVFCSFLKRYGKPAVLIAAVFTVTAGSGIRHLNVDTDPVRYFHAEAQVRKDNEYVNRVFGGSAQLNVVARGDIKSPDMLGKMEKLQEFLKRNKHVSKTQSLADAIKRMNRAFHNDDPAHERIPDSRDVVAQYLLLYENSGGTDLDRFVDFPYEHAQVTARVNTTSANALRDLMHDAQGYVADELNSDEFPMVTGFVSVLGVLVQMVVRGQLISLGLSLLLIFLISAVVFRSLVAGGFVVFPLAFAMVTVFGLMGYFDIELNIATAMLASVVVGVGVDYTIHFLWHFKEEYSSHGDAWKAVEDTLATSGRGIIVNALSVIVGFSVMMFSNFLPIFFFGFLLTISITSCLVGALAILPVLVTTFQPSFLGRPAGDGTASVAEPIWAEETAPSRALTFATRLGAALCIAGLGYLLYLVYGFIADWYTAIPAATGFWAALWEVIKENPSIAAALYVLGCLNSAGVAEFKFGKNFVLAFLLALPLTPFIMIGVWARRK